VERTLAWISRCRRLSQDDEKLPRTWETFIYLAMIELMLKRVAETLATSKTPSNSG
ncbi:MAG: IS5 family transposase ISFal3B, partial [Cyanobacteria bacterium SW_6_48_11]